MPFSEEELAAFKDQRDKVQNLAESITAPEGWHLREQKHSRAVYQHNTLPVILEIRVNGSYPVQEKSLVRGMVKSYGSITLGENHFSPDAGEVFGWAKGFMQENPRPVELVEGSRVSWWDGKRKPNPSETRFSDIAVIR